MPHTRYNKISAVIGKAGGKDARPMLTPQQIAGLKTVAGAALAVVAVAGIASLAIVAPNLLAAIGGLSKQLGHGTGKRLSKKEKVKAASRAVYYLKRHGYINMRSERGGWQVWLSELGKKKLLHLNLDSMAVAKPKTWDGKWWQVAADIPTEHYRTRADLLRKKLKAMRFYSLQRSLWFYPYDPRKEVEFVTQFYGIANYVTLMEINRLDKDDEQVLIKHFKTLKIM